MNTKQKVILRTIRAAKKVVLRGNKALADFLGVSDKAAIRNLKKLRDENKVLMTVEREPGSARKIYTIAIAGAVGAFSSFLIPLPNTLTGFQAQTSQLSFQTSQLSFQTSQLSKTFFAYKELNTRSKIKDPHTYIPISLSTSQTMVGEIMINQEKKNRVQGELSEMPQSIQSQPLSDPGHPIPEKKIPPQKREKPQNGRWKYEEQTDIRDEFKKIDDSPLWAEDIIDEKMIKAGCNWIQPMFRSRAMKLFDRKGNHDQGICPGLKAISKNPLYFTNQVCLWARTTDHRRWYVYRLLLVDFLLEEGVLKRQKKGGNFQNFLHECSLAAIAAVKLGRSPYQAANIVANRFSVMYGLPALFPKQEDFLLSEDVRLSAQKVRAKNELPKNGDATKLTHIDDSPQGDSVQSEAEKGVCTQENPAQKEAHESKSPKSREVINVAYIDDLPQGDPPQSEAGTGIDSQENSAQKVAYESKPIKIEDPTNDESDEEICSESQPSTPVPGRHDDLRIEGSPDDEHGSVDSWGWTASEKLAARTSGSRNYHFRDRSYEYCSGGNLVDRLIDSEWVDAETLRLMKVIPAHREETLKNSGLEPGDSEARYKLLTSKGYYSEVDALTENYRQNLFACKAFRQFVMNIMTTEEVTNARNAASYIRNICREGEIMTVQNIVDDFLDTLKTPEELEASLSPGEKNSREYLARLRGPKISDEDQAILDDERFMKWEANRRSWGNCEVTPQDVRDDLLKKIKSDPKVISGTYAPYKQQMDAKRRRDNLNILNLELSRRGFTYGLIPEKIRPQLENLMSTSHLTHEQMVILHEWLQQYPYTPEALAEQAKASTQESVVQRVDEYREKVYKPSRLFFKAFVIAAATEMGHDPYNLPEDYADRARGYRTCEIEDAPTLFLLFYYTRMQYEKTKGKEAFIELGNRIERETEIPYFSKIERREPEPMPRAGA